MGLARLFKALSEPSRLRILALLREQELSGAEIVSILEMTQSRVSRHIRTLRDAGLVEARRDGSWVYFRPATEPPDPDRQSLLEPIWTSLDGTLEEETRRRLRAAVLGRSARVRSFFDDKAGDWDELRGTRSDELSVLRMLSPLLPERLRVADLGTGTGALLPHLCRHAQLTLGIDSSPAMLARAQIRNAEAGTEQVGLIQAELEAIPLRSGSLDVALCHMVLHYTSEPSRTLTEIARIVAPGGMVVVADLAHHGEEELREELAHQWLGFTQMEITNWFEKAGLWILSVRQSPTRLRDRELTMFYAYGKKV